MYILDGVLNDFNANKYEDNFVKHMNDIVQIIVLWCDFIVIKTSSQSLYNIEKDDLTLKLNIIY